MKYVVANWKSYITDHKKAKDLFEATHEASEMSDCQVVVCPPFPYLPDVKHDWDMEIGAQDVFWEEEGAYTGEVTIKMLKNQKVNYVILGHSERRRYLGETDELINKKVQAALKAGLKVILCVGEKERKDMRVIPSIVSDQIKADLKDVPKTKIKNVIVAYEPIWAIGSGEADTPEDAHQASLYIRKTISKMYHAKAGVNIKVLYGGSVNSKNVKEFVTCHGIDGVLVGGASSKADEFVKMIKIVG